MSSAGFTSSITPGKRSSPAALTSLSAKVAIPSMNQRGWPPFVIQSLPKTSFTAAGSPNTVSRCRMWVYSCEISS